MRLPIAHLLKLERAGILRWVHPYSVSLELGRQPPHAGAVLFFQKEERTWTVSVRAIEGEVFDLEYTGPQRPREEAMK